MKNDHQSVEQIFGAALDLPPLQRGAFLDGACQGAPELRRLVEELLAEDQRAGSFLATPILQHFGPDIEAHSLTATPTAQLEGQPRFAPTELIAGRFRVVRFIARGGMGEVYEVEDHLLHDTHVALKIIRPDIASDPESSRRFEHEVLLARKVNHRNLCPIYEIFRCELPPPPFLFLTMKLLHGESLETRLRHSPRLSIEEAMQICNQMIAGIVAMHGAGIIHRDIKPNNVMLEPSGSEICVTIMDFGLARLSESSATVLKTGLIAGTPGYLAPELLRGSSPSQASDLFALGVVLHQMLTGERPSVSKSGYTIVVSPSLASSNAPAILIQAVRDLLSEEPERRCRAFERIAAPNEASTVPARRAIITRRGFALGAGTAFCGLCGGAIWKQREIYDFFHPLPGKRFVALLNWPPPSDNKITPMLLGLIDTMVDVLSRAEAFDHNFFVACQNPLTEMNTPAQLNEVRESLGANLVLATSGTVAGDGIHLLLQVLDPASSRVLRAKKLRAPRGDQFTLPDRAARVAAELLDVASGKAKEKRNRVGTENADALAAFQAAEALMKEPNNSGLDAAIEKFKLAVEADPHFAIAHARLAVAYIRLFWVHRDESSIVLARANAETALRLDPDSVDGHAALARVYLDTGDPTRALHEIGKALKLDPSDSRIIIYQAQINFNLNRWQEAEEAYKRVLKVRPNLWLAYNELGNNYSYQGKYQLALQAFQAASVSAPRNAQAVANTGAMYFLLGDFEKADAAIARSIALAPLSWAFEIRAEMLRARGKFQESLQAALEAAGMDPEESTIWLDVGDAYANMPHHDKDARTAYKRALDAMTNQLALNPKDGPGWMLLALYHVKAGDPAAASALVAKADDLNAIDIYSLMCKVRILELLGQRDAALSTLAICLRMGATSTQIQSTNDLKMLRSDTRYASLIRSSAGLLT